MDDPHPTALHPPFPTPKTYTPLSTHEQATPPTFFSAKEILHFSLGPCTIRVLCPNTDAPSPWHDLLSSTNPPSDENAPASRIWRSTLAYGFIGSGRVVILPGMPPAEVEAEGEVEVDGATEAQTGTGVAIPYPNITLHAIRRGAMEPDTAAADEIRDEGAAGPSLYLQISSRDPFLAGEEEDEGADDVEVLITPVAGSGVDGAEMEPEERVREMYAALTRCAEMHPDPMDEQSSENGGGGGMGVGGLEGGVPGAGGWITSENAHEFEGAFGGGENGGGGIHEEGGEGRERLGPGAGTRREREGGEERSANGVNGDGDGDKDADGETKWQRTG